MVGVLRRALTIDLNERDVLAFEALHEHGPLPTGYLFEFTKHLPRSRNLKSFQHRLTKLYNGTEHSAGYLQKPPQQRASCDARCQDTIYDLTARSLAVLADRGIASLPRTDPFLHRLMSACVSASIRLAAIERGLRYGSKEQIFAHPKCPQAAKDAPNPLALPVWSFAAGRYLVPDDLFVIQYPGPKTRFFAVEIDRRTESINSDTAKTAYGRKVQAYVEAIKTRAYHKHWGIPGLTVLTVTTNAVHLRSMIKYVRSLSEPRLASRFLFKSKSHFGADWQVPPVMHDLLTEPWIAADGSQVHIGE